MKYLILLLLSSLLFTLQISAIQQNDDLEKARKLLNDGKFEEGKTILKILLRMMIKIMKLILCWEEPIWP